MSISDSTVRIRGGSGEILGAGILVSETKILTCAHIIHDALGRETDTVNARVVVDFPFIRSPKHDCPAIVEFTKGGRDQREDYAGLTLEDPAPPSARPARLVPAEDVYGHRFRTMGFPQGHDEGQSAYGHILDRLEGDWLQIEPDKEVGAYVRKGFSGGILWDSELEAPTGMVVTADKEKGGNRVAYVAPASVLIPMVGCARGKRHPA